MFDINTGVLGEEDCFDPAWLDEAAWLDDAPRPQEIDQPLVSACAPSGWLALELDQGGELFGEMCENPLFRVGSGCDNKTSPQCDTGGERPSAKTKPSLDHRTTCLTRTNGTTELRLKPAAPAQCLTCMNVLGELRPDGKRLAGNRVRPGQTWRWYRHEKTPAREPTFGSDAGVLGTFRHVPKNGCADPAGATSEHNLHASCRRHHRLKTHAPGWDVDQHPDGRITWTDPTGHTHTSYPHDYRPDPDPPPDEDPPPF